MAPSLVYHGLIRALLSLTLINQKKFLETSCYHGEDIIDEYIIDDSDNYLPLDEVFIDFSIRQKLKKLFKEGGIDQAQYDTVPAAAIAFYRKIWDEMDMSCSFWEQAVWIDFFNKGSAKWSHAEYLLKCNASHSSSSS